MEVVGDIQMVISWTSILGSQVSLAGEAETTGITTVRSGTIGPEMKSDPPAPPDPNKRFTIPEAPPWLLPAVTGGLVLATCVLAPELCVPAIACAARR